MRASCMCAPVRLCARAGKKYVRMYSQDYQLLTSGIEGTCTLDDGTYSCGAEGCTAECDALSQGV